MEEAIGLLSDIADKYSSEEGGSRSSLISEIKSLRKRVYQEADVVIQRALTKTGNEPVCKEELSTGAIVDAMNVATMFKATRNLHFGDTELHESANHQQECFSKDTSTLLTGYNPLEADCGEDSEFLKENYPEITTSEQEKEWFGESMQAYFEGLFDGFIKTRNDNPTRINPTALKQKTTPCTQRTVREGGRDAEEKKIISEFLSRTFAETKVQEALQIGRAFQIPVCTTTENLQRCKLLGISEIFGEITLGQPDGDQIDFQDIKLISRAWKALVEKEIVYNNDWERTLSSPFREQTYLSRKENNRACRKVPNY